MAEEKTCCICGRKISEKDGWLLPEKLGRGYVPYCTTCMDKVYKYMATVLGYKFAMFVCAAMFNMPYYPELLTESKKYISGNRSAWGGYITALRANGHGKVAEGECGEFPDGITDVKKAFGGEYATLQVDDAMLDDEEYQSGRMAQEEFWGSGPDDAPYTQADYRELEKVFEALSKNRPYSSDQTRLAMQRIAKWTLEQERCFKKRNFDGVEKMQKLIKAEMESEQLRKKDELPQDTVRLDDIVQAVERAGLPMHDYDELCKILANYALHESYPYTRDAADQMILLIRNCTAWNEGRAEVASLPPEFAVEDRLGEFAQKADEVEKQIYEELQLTPMNLREEKGEA